MTTSFIPTLIDPNTLPFAESIRLLYWGPSGAGKTWFAGSAGPRSLFINIGDGFETIQSPAFQKAFGYMPMLVNINEKLGDRGVVEDAVLFDAVADTIDYAIEKWRDKFDTIVVDDMTALRRGALHKGLEINQSTGKSKTLGQRKQFSAIIPAVQDYGVEMNLIEQFVAAYTSIAKQQNFHLILTAHERVTMKKGDKIGDIAVVAKRYPAFTGQTFPDQVPMYFSDVWHAEVVSSGSGPIFRARTVGDENLCAKTRYGGVFSAVEQNPNFLKLMEKLKANKYRVERVNEPSKI